jgi:hypothetical protein
LLRRLREVGRRLDVIEVGIVRDGLDDGVAFGDVDADGVTLGRRELGKDVVVRRRRMRMLGRGRGTRPNQSFSDS